MADDHKLRAPPPAAFYPGNVAANSAVTAADHPDAMPRTAEEQPPAAHGDFTSSPRPADPCRLTLNSRHHHPQLLIQLDRLQQEIEAHGGHAVLELVPATSSETLSSDRERATQHRMLLSPDSPPAALDTSPGATAAAASAGACTTLSGNSPSTLLPPKSPAGIWRGHGFRQSQRPRQLVRPPSVPARLDSMAVRFTVGRGDGYPASQSTSAAPRMRIESPRSTPQVTPIVSSESEPEMDDSALNAEKTGSAVGPPSRPSPHAVAIHSHAAISARRHLSVRPFRSSSNIDLPEMAIADSPHINTYSRPTWSFNTVQMDMSPSTTTAVAAAVSMSSPHAPLPASPATPRRYAQRVLVQTRDFKSVRGPRTSQPPPPGGVVSPRGEQGFHDKPSPRSSNISHNLKNLKQGYPYSTVTHGEAAKGAVRVSHRSAKSVGGDYSDLTSSTNGFLGTSEIKKLAGAVGRSASDADDNTYTTYFCEEFRSRAAPSHASVGNMKLLVHANSSGETWERRTVSPGTNDGPTVPAPSPHQPINHSTSGSSFGQKADSVACSPRQLQLRERILGIRYSCVRDKFHISKEKIGEGGSGEIRKCLEWSTGTVFACKTIQKSNIKTKSEVSDLRTEVLLMDLLKTHYGIVQVHDVFEDHKAVHLVMELCNGGDLFDFIQSAPKGRLTEQQAASVMRQLLNALHHCHSLGVLHRDVKPENILLCDRMPLQSGNGDVRIKLSDFGVAGFLDEDGVCTDTTGTSEYMAPEVAMKAPYNAKADVWSAGVVLHAMLAGALPCWAALPDEFSEQAERAGGGSSRGKGKTMQEGIARNKLTLKSAVWRGVSEEAKDLLRALLRKDPEERPSALEALGECGASGHWAWSQCGAIEHGVSAVLLGIAWVRALPGCGAIGHCLGAVLLGIAWVRCCWALRGCGAIGHCVGAVLLGIGGAIGHCVGAVLLGIAWVRALHGCGAFGHRVGAVLLGIAWVRCYWALRGCGAIGHCVGAVL
ncbi:unnamed protein product [Closterium sp. Yama58-4]|nr:unnamed protein product [Closterium sp. Yama58-4]